MISEHMSDDIPLKYGNPHSHAILQFCLKLERFKPHNATCHPTKCDVINDIKLFPTVYCRIYCRANFFMLSKQMSRYKSKYIRIGIYCRVSGSGVTLLVLPLSRWGWIKFL